MAGLFAIALATPFTSKFGITLVKSDPGPSVIRSAHSMAAMVSFKGLQSSGTSRTV